MLIVCPLVYVLLISLPQMTTGVGECVAQRFAQIFCIIILIEVASVINGVLTGTCACHLVAFNGVSKASRHGKLNDSS